MFFFLLEIWSFFQCTGNHNISDQACLPCYTFWETSCTQHNTPFNKLVILAENYRVVKTNRQAKIATMTQ